MVEYSEVLQNSFLDSTAIAIMLHVLGILCRSLIEAITCSQSCFGWINSKTHFPHSFQVHGKCLYYHHAYWNDILFKTLFTESVRQL